MPYDHKTTAENDYTCVTCETRGPKWCGEHADLLIPAAPRTETVHTDPLGIATPNPRPRCLFGRPHGWAYISFTEDGQEVPEGLYVKCFTCGQVEVDR